MKQNRLVLTDGDWNMYLPLRVLQCIEESPWYGSMHKLCQFHLLCQPWLVKFSGFGKKSPEKKKILDIIYHWCTSWFVNVETIEELEISCSDLFKYIEKNTVSKKDKQKETIIQKNDLHERSLCLEVKSPSQQCILPLDESVSSTVPVKDKVQIKLLTQDESMKIVEFIKSNLLDKKEMFAKCYYLDVRSYEENTTNPVEQQNSANKTGHIKTKPNMSLKASAVKLTSKSRSSINEKI